MVVGGDAVQSRSVGAIEPVFGGCVLDANVLYPAPLRDTLLRAAEAGLFQPHWSARIIDEVVRNLILDRRSDAVKGARLVVTLRRAFPDAEVDVPDAVVERMSNAVEDRHVLATAVVANAAVIVTANVRDFPSGVLLPHAVEAIAPDRFLRRPYDAAPSVMRDLLVAQAADLTNPPMTLAEVLTELALHAPRFVQRVAAEKL